VAATLLDILQIEAVELEQMRAGLSEREGGSSLQTLGHTARRWLLAVAVQKDLIPRVAGEFADGADNPLRDELAELVAQSVTGPDGEVRALALDLLDRLRDLFNPIAVNPAIALAAAHDAIQAVLEAEPGLNIEVVAHMPELRAQVYARMFQGEDGLSKWQNRAARVAAGVTGLLVSELATLIGRAWYLRDDGRIARSARSHFYEPSDREVGLVVGIVQYFQARAKAVFPPDGA
jgi:hypothetical protein